MPSGVHDRPTPLTTELKELAVRGIGRAFERVGKTPPLELPTLFAIVEMLFDYEWKGTDQQKVGAIKEVIRLAAKKLQGPAANWAKVNMQHVALLLYDLVNLGSDLALKLTVSDSRYALLCRVLEHEMQIDERQRERIAASMRAQLAVALQSLVTEPDSVIDVDMALDATPPRSGDTRADTDTPSVIVDQSMRNMTITDGVFQIGYIAGSVRRDDE